MYEAGFVERKNITSEVYVIMFIEPHGKCAHYLSIHLSSFCSFLLFFFLCFLFPFS